MQIHQTVCSIAAPKHAYAIKNIKSDKNAEKLSSLNITKEEKENLIKEIDNLKKEIKNLELNDNEEEDLNILFESLENIKNIIFENSKEKSKKFPIDGFSTNLFFNSKPASEIISYNLLLPIITVSITL